MSVSFYEFISFTFTCEGYKLNPFIFIGCVLAYTQSLKVFKLVALETPKAELL